MSDTPFSQLELPTSMLENLNDLGYLQMTEIQQQALPEVLAGHDLIAKAKTGSGKTAAFGIGLLLKLKQRSFKTQGLVLCPTRELATQVANELRKLARFTQNVKILTICGGQSIGPQIGSLEHGAHIVVGTPGRIKDHLRKQTLRLEHVETLVLDEADRMLDMGFADDIRQIIAMTPSKRQTLLFSATYPSSIKHLSKDILNNPTEVLIESTHTQLQIEQRFFEVDPSVKIGALLQLLAVYKPTSALIFCNMKKTCSDVQEALRNAGYSASAIHGDLEQRDRDQVLVQFSNNSCNLLIATDVAARGIDIDSLPCVINYDLTRDSEVHTHRIGRTGRAGNTGLVLNLYQPSEAYKVSAIEDRFNTEFTIKDLPEVTEHTLPEKPPMVTLCISGGKKNKIRPGDLLGALTGDAGLLSEQVGKINIYDFNAYVAVARPVARKALEQLSKGKIKGKKFKVRKL